MIINFVVGDLSIVLGERTAFIFRLEEYGIRVSETRLLLDDWLTMHRSITLVDLHLDAQNSYLFTYNLLKSSTCFEHYPAHLQDVYVVIVYMQPLVSSLCIKSEINQGYITMHGQPVIKICNAKQARQIYQYKKIKIKLYKNNADIWYNKICNDDTRCCIYTITT